MEPPGSHSSLVLPKEVRRRRFIWVFLSDLFYPSFIRFYIMFFCRVLVSYKTVVHGRLTLSLESYSFYFFSRIFESPF